MENAEPEPMVLTQPWTEQHATSFDGVGGWPLSSEEASLLDADLRRYVERRLGAWGRKHIDFEDADDIADTAWMKSLPQPRFQEATTEGRRFYLRSAAANHMKNLVRREDERADALRVHTHQVLENGTAVRAEDVWDEIASQVGQGLHRISAHRMLRFRADFTGTGEDDARRFLAAVYDQLYGCCCERDCPYCGHRCEDCPRCRDGNHHHHCWWCCRSSCRVRRYRLLAKLRHVLGVE